MAVSEDFDFRTNGIAEVSSTWIEILEAVLEARPKVDPNTVSASIWNAFLVFSLVLVPCVQGR